MRILLIIAKWMPGGAIGACAALQLEQAFSEHSYVTVGFSLLCMGILWKTAEFKTEIIQELKVLQVALPTLVTEKQLRLKIYEERELNDKRYMKSDSCGDQHAALNQILDKVYHQQQPKSKSAKAGE